MANSADPDQLVSTLFAKAEHIWVQQDKGYLSMKIYEPVHSKTNNKTSVTSVTFLFVLRFYGPVNPMGSCRARSVYLTTRLLGRLSPLSG